MDRSQLHRITAPHFCAGLISQGNIVTRTAPILHYMRHWDTAGVHRYCRRKHWRIETLDQAKPALEGEKFGGAA